MFKKINLCLLLLTLFACSDNNSPVATVNSPSALKPDTDSMAFQEGVHYRVLDTPLAQATSTTPIIVTEFFWYGCSHCSRFEPYLNAWNKTKPAAVVLKASPAVWSKPMELHAKAFFMVQSLQQSHELHTRLFELIMSLGQEKNLDQHKRRLAALFAEFGLAEKDFYQQLDSPEIEKQLIDAISLMQQIGINGTPTIMVNGKYVVLSDSIKTYEDILAITDFLIKKELPAAF